MAAAGTGRMFACQQITPRAGRPSDPACLSDLQAAAIPSDCNSMPLMPASTAMLIACLQPWPNRGQRACDRQRSIQQRPFGCIFDYETNFSVDYELKPSYKVHQPRS